MKKQVSNLSKWMVGVLVLISAIGAGAFLLPSQTEPSIRTETVPTTEYNWMVSVEELFPQTEKHRVQTERIQNLAMRLKEKSGSCVFVSTSYTGLDKREIKKLNTICRQKGIQWGIQLSATTAMQDYQSLEKSSAFWGYLWQDDPENLQYVPELINTGRDIIWLTAPSENTIEKLQSPETDKIDALAIFPGPELDETTEKFLTEYADIFPGKSLLIAMPGDMNLTTGEEIVFFCATKNIPCNLLSIGYEETLSNKQAVDAWLGCTNNISELLENIPDLSILSTLSVGYPKNKFSTTEATVWIMGTSDKNQVLTVNGKEFEQQGKNGCFGFEADLKIGQNTFYFKNGDDTLTLSVTRNKTSSVSTMTQVLQRFPTGDAICFAGQELVFRCVAPSKSTVVATVNGTKITMQQVASASKGVPATFKGVYEVPENLSAGSITSLGTVTYTLTYNKKTTTQESAGILYVAGAGVTPIVVCDTEEVSLLEDYKDSSSFDKTYHKGAWISMKDCFQSNGTIYYEVDGGYIVSERATFEKNVVNNSHQVSKVKYDVNGRDTTITLVGTNHVPTTGEMCETGVRFCLQNLEPDFTINQYPEDLFSGVLISAEGNDTVLNFILKENSSIWGFDYQYDEDGNLQLLFKSKPVVSNTESKPLEGITITLDPGHGNSDPGTLGAAGSNGPMESELNLAVALVLQGRLQQLGAKVNMIRSTDDYSAEKITMDPRIRSSVDNRSDIYLSIHHNAGSVVSESNGKWCEAWYYTECSEKLADCCCNAVSEALDRASKGAKQGYYYVTRQSLCPAVLFEVGFLTNPEQYEECCDWPTIVKTANALANGILNFLSEGGYT